MVAPVRGVPVLECMYERPADISRMIFLEAFDYVQIIHNCPVPKRNHLAIIVKKKPKAQITIYNVRKTFGKNSF